MDEYYWKHGPLYSGNGTIHSSDGTTTPCTYRIQRRERYSRPGWWSGLENGPETPVGIHDFDTTIKSFFTHKTLDWIAPGSDTTLELELADGCRVRVFPRSSSPVTMLVYYSLGGDIPEG